MALWNPRFGNESSAETHSGAAQLRDEADTTALQLVDAANAVGRPDGIWLTYKELEFDERAAEQAPLFDAEGEVAARTPAVQAAGLLPRAITAQKLVDDHLPSVTRAQQRYERCVDALGAFRVRAPRGDLWYGLRTGIFLLGDLAGISGAAISLGEIPANAYLMAGSAAVATVAAGLVGKDVRSIYLRERRAATVEQFTPEQEPYRHLFTTSRDGTKLLRLVVGASTGVGIVLALGIFGLRTAVEGSLNGLVYGAIALAVAVGSFLSAFAHADEIADQIDAALHDYERELHRTRRLANSRPWAAHERQQKRAESTRDEFADRGAAAGLALTGAKWRLLSRNPGVVGHGPADVMPERIGTKARRGGEKR